ncbi:MAG TPA: ABC transporter permease, partial [Chitinophagaceae bacterium]|nr:ABC transporter permease [Chitinophagaceae bacterium]
MTINFSNTGLFRQRLLKNRGAVFGLAVICFTVAVSVFGYYIAPDNSPNANRIIPEIANHKPGFSISLLRVEKVPAGENNNFLQVLLNGKKDLYDYVPITAFNIAHDSLIADKYVDEGVTEKVKYPLTKIASHFTLQKNVVRQKFWLGTDKFGRDILSRLIIGTRVSLSVGLVTVIISLTIGIMLGAVAGYFRGWVDEVIMWLINVIWSIPTLLLVFAVTLLLGKGFWQVFIAVGLTMWVNVARLVRGQVLAVRE